MSEAQHLNVHIYPAPIVAESRIFRQTLAVSRASIFDRIEICGTPAPGLPDTQPLPEDRLVRRVGTAPKQNGSVLSRIWYQLAWSRRVYRTYAGARVGAVNAHSVAVLPVAALIARRTGARLIYDTHELETETSTSRGLQGRIFRWVERLLIRKCDVVFVVNDLIREWYEQTYPGVRVVSVVNTPDHSRVGPAHDLRAAFQIPADRRLFVHVGNLVGSRHIPEIIEVFSRRPNHHLVFLGDGDFGRAVDDASERFPNIHHHKSVDSDSVVPTLATADVGICLIEPTCLSYALSLPNKAIEYASACIPFLQSDLPAIRRLLSNRLEEFVVTTVGELGPRIDSLSDETIERGRQDLQQVSLPSWSRESARMVDVYRELVVTSPRPESSGGQPAGKGRP